MKERENINIDESIKVNSWGTESPSFPQHTQEFFQKIARNGREEVRGEQILQTPGFQGDMAQVGELEEGFKRLRNEQIEKLRHLKTEYEEIRKIATDYVSPRREQYSPTSSRQSQSQVISPKGGKSRANGFGGGVRDCQILQLQRRQLQIMVQNSMKKIEELLHNEMEYKKTIHELRLKGESRTVVEEGAGVLRGRQRREKESGEQVRMLQLEREGLLSTVSSLKERVKYLQAGLGNSEVELRKVFEQKRSYQELIRMERDKFMNLEITYRREKREHEIMEKDKDAEINHLLRLKDVRETGLEAELKGTISSLQEELRTKEKRYVLLLEQFENYQKERVREEKEQEIKLVNEILNKSSEEPNKFMQETLNNILQRISELETRPSVPLGEEKREGEQSKVEPINHVSVHTEIIDRSDKVEHLQSVVGEYSSRMGEFNTKIEELTKRNSQLESANRQLNQQITALKLQKQTIEQKNKILVDAQQHLQAQFQQYKEEQKRKLQLRDKSLPEFRVQLKDNKSEAITVQKNELTVNSVLVTSRVSKLEGEVQRLGAVLQAINAQKSKLQDENRGLLLKVSKLQFGLDKAVKEGQFQLDINKKSADVVINGLSQDLNQMRDLFNRANNEVIRLRKILQGNSDTGKQETANLMRTIETLQKEKNNSETQLKALFNNNVAKLKEEHNAQVQELTAAIQSLTNLNRKLQATSHYSRNLEGENEELKYLIQNIQTQPVQTQNVQSVQTRQVQGGQTQFVQVQTVPVQYVQVPVQSVQVPVQTSQTQYVQVQNAPVQYVQPAIQGSQTHYVQVQNPTVQYVQTQNVPAQNQSQTHYVLVQNGPGQSVQTLGSQAISSQGGQWHTQNSVDGVVYRGSQADTRWVEVPNADGAYRGSQVETRWVEVPNATDGGTYRVSQVQSWPQQPATSPQYV